MLSDEAGCLYMTKEFVVRKDRGRGSVSLYRTSISEMSVLLEASYECDCDRRYTLLQPCRYDSTPRP